MIGKLLAEGISRLRELGFNYVDKSAETGSARRITQDYLDSLTIEMRLLDSAPASTEFTLFGKTFLTPVMTGALSGLKSICPDAMLSVASGIADAGTIMWVGLGETSELQSLIECGAAVVKVVKPYRNHDLILAKITEAEKYGAFAVGMDIDFICGGKMGDHLIMGDKMGPKTVADISSFVSATKLPFILKGVLSVQDAYKAMEAGVSAIVVSHHGGMVLDYAVPPLQILPHIAKVVNGKVPIFVDSGINRGSEVFKALALGADGVLIGKTVIAGLAAEGTEGVRKIIEGTNEELRRIMQLTGCITLQDISSDLIWNKNR